ncbi:MAG: Uma2 family endonuclease [Myxococcales bacterium]|nr:Uma2 family endonuclease [Myxococcales bacterium]
MNAAARQRMTYAEYLAAEDKSETKHEYLRGEVFAMAGGTLEHSRLAVNMASELRNALGGRPCVVFNSDARVLIAATDRSTYPDLSVVCGKVETAQVDGNAITNPVVIVEVLSDPTEAEDRGEKFAHYRHLPSLRDYVLVSQRTARIEVYRRENDFWAFTEAGPGGAVRLVSLDLSLAVDAVYRDPLAAP